MRKKNRLKKEDVKQITSIVEKSINNSLLPTFFVNGKVNEGQNLPEVQVDEDYFEKKDRESNITNTAFQNFIKKVELLEKTVAEQGDEIEEVREEFRRIKKKQKKMKIYLDRLEDSIESMKEKIFKLEKNVRENAEKIKMLFLSVRNILCVAGAGGNMKKSDIVLASSKLVRRKEKEQRKYQELIRANDNKTRREWK